MLAVLLWPGAARATQYKIDNEHTTVGFKIRHLFSQVMGGFDTYEGSFVYTPGKPEEWTVSATIQAASINTKVAMRDNHLRSKDFFHVEQYPTITFRSTKVTDVTGSSAKVHGVLAIHGVEKPVVLNVEIHGEGKDPWGNLRSGFSARVRINRKDFGLTWNQTVETGQLLVGEEVEIILEVEGIA
jgi:polyisoprenoid-binding protein YceI